MSYKSEMVRCPFNEHHVIIRARFPAHLVKCRKQYGGDEFSICPYNSTHYVLTPNLENHCENCPDRRRVEADMYVVGEPPHRPTIPEKIDVPPPSEVWDDDADHGSYLDVKDEIISKLPVIRIPVGLTKAERRQFLLNETKRFERISRAEAAASSSGASGSNSASAATQQKPGTSAKGGDNGGCEEPMIEVRRKHKGKGKKKT